MFDPKNIKKEFPLFEKDKKLVYLDSAATTQKPQRVIDRLAAFYSEEYATVHRGAYSLSLEATARYDETRKRLASFLNVNQDEIVFSKGTTDSINLVALSLAFSYFKRGDEVIISEMEHHSNIVPWQLLAQRKKIKIKVLKVNDRAELEMRTLDRLLTNRTKLVSIAHIANSTGSLNPIRDIIKKAHRKGVLVLIDGAQAIGHLKVDLKALDADFYAFSSHKMYGPNGVGVLYGKRYLLDRMAPVQGGGDMIKEVTLAKTTFQEAPLKFEAGTPVIAEVVALKDALDFIEELGIDNIRDHEMRLLDYATAELERIKRVKIIGNAKQKGSIVSFIIQGAHPLDIASFLNLKRIAIRTGHLCAQPTLQRFNVDSLARISFGVYNSLEDIDLFIDVIEEAISFLKL